jgi:hypothetical protein
MKQFNKTKIAAAVGTAALAMTLGAPANAAISLGGDNGWEVTYGGFINLFYTQSDWDYGNATSEDSAHLNEGLLPAFHTFTVKSPTINGLTGTGQITFAPDSSGAKGKELNKGGSEIDMREVFFNVEGSFGTISAGRTLALFQRQAILKDYTLFGVGAMAGPDTGGTSLGRIGFGYVYPDFRTRFVYQTPNINGFQLSVGVFDPDEGTAAGATAGNNGVETDTPQFQAEGTYNTAFGGGNISAWAGFIWQEMEIASGTLGNAAATSQDVEMFGVNLGLDITYGGFNVAGSWYTGEGLGTILLNLPGTGAFTCGATGCTENDNEGYYVQGGYTFNGKTKLGVSYGESTADGVGGAADLQNDMWTVGVYHDVNSWLKLVAEYSDQHSDYLGTGGGHQAETFSVGGFLLW